jgi:hypothetical protein
MRRVQKASNIGKRALLWPLEDPTWSTTCEVDELICLASGFWQWKVEARAGDGRDDLSANLGDRCP